MKKITSNIMPTVSHRKKRRIRRRESKNRELSMVLLVQYKDMLSLLSERDGNVFATPGKL
jgi:hypothetical protein